MEQHSIQNVLIDNSFLTTLLNEKDKLNHNAEKYFEYFLNSGNHLFISTVSVAEFCVRGKLNEIPFNNLKVIPFNINHAEKAGDFANIIFSQYKAKDIKLTERKIIPNDVKIFSQCELEISVSHCISKDEDFQKIHNSLSKNLKIKTKIIDLNISLKDFLGNLF